MPKWGMREVQSITHDEVQVWVSALAESKSASVVLRAEGILRALLAKAKADKCITTIHAKISNCPGNVARSTCI